MSARRVIVDRDEVEAPVARRRDYMAYGTETVVVTSLINFFVGLAELILLIRVLFRLFNANATTPFVNWIYTMSDTLLTPFRGIFPAGEISPGYVLDFSALFAMLVYGLAGYLLIMLVRGISSRTSATL